MNDKLRTACEQASENVSNWPTWKKEAAGVQLKDGGSCEWSLDCDFCNRDTVYLTDCGHSFTLNEGNLEDNNFMFCPFCGGKINC